MPRLVMWALTALTLLSIPPAMVGAAVPCVVARAEARWVAYGYDHIVHLENTCAAAHTCTVATDVNPAPQTVRVPGETAVQVLTFRGSPARVFTPVVACAPAHE
jgi:hypothetical protein